MPAYIPVIILHLGSKCTFLFQDYTGDHVNAGNFYAVLLGNKSALTGGSGKVVDSGPDDHIFVYYTDHGGLGSLGRLVVLT